MVCQRDFVAIFVSSLHCELHTLLSLHTKIKTNETSAKAMHDPSKICKTIHLRVRPALYKTPKRHSQRRIAEAKPITQTPHHDGSARAPTHNCLNPPRPIQRTPPPFSSFSPPSHVVLGLLVRRLPAGPTRRHLASASLPPSPNNVQPRDRCIVATHTRTSNATTPTTWRRVLLILTSLALSPTTYCLAQSSLSSFRKARTPRCVLVGFNTCE
jgi:hypothetical protein